MHALVLLVKRINRLAIVTDLLNRLVIVGWRAYLRVYIGTKTNWTGYTGTVRTDQLYRSGEDKLITGILTCRF